MSEGTVLIVVPDRSLAVTMSRALREQDYSVDVTADAVDTMEEQSLAYRQGGQGG